MRWSLLDGRATSMRGELPLLTYSRALTDFFVLLLQMMEADFGKLEAS
jgi:hypothetical protein